LEFIRESTANNEIGLSQSITRSLITSVSKVD
jgi:hypothetical protein